MRRRASVHAPLLLLALPCALAVLPYAPGAADAQDAPGSALPQTAPVGPAYVSEALDLYRRPPSRYEAGQLVSRWLVEGGPRSARDSLAVARLWNAASATAWALAWLPRPPGSDPELADRVRLERARALLGRMPLDGLPTVTDAENRTGASEFWSVCASPYPAVAQALWLDVRGLLTPDEREAWEEAHGGDERCAVLRSAFAERAWRSATTPDARLAEHYRRLARARGCCWITRPREQDPFSSAWFRGRPEGLEVDDRGLFLLRMGAPDHVESNVLADATPGIGETWVYERPDGAWIFYFVPGDFRAGYVLTERFGPQSLPGTGFYQRYMTRLAVGRGSARRLLFSRQSADALDAALDEAEGRMTGRRLQMAARELQTRAITEVPDAPALEPRLAMRVQTLGFWNPGRETATVWTLASVRAGDLGAVREAETPVFGLEGRLAWLRGESSDDAGLLVQEWQVPATGVAPDDAVEFRMAAELPSGRWPTTFAVRDEGATDAAAGAWIQDTLVVPDLRSPLPALSDLALSPDSGGAWTRDGEVFLSPSPSHLTDPGGFVHLYFEAYGFRPGSEYDLDVRVVPAGEADRIWTVDPESTAFRLAFRSTMPEGRTPIGTHHLRLDLSGAEPGEYVVGVRAQDARTRRLSLPTAAALVVRHGG